MKNFKNSVRSMELGNFWRAFLVMFPRIHVECEKQNLQERKDKHEAFVNDYLNKKEAERKAVEKKKKEEAEKAKFYKTVERLANIDPHMAEVYVQALNHK